MNDSSEKIKQLVIFEDDDFIIRSLQKNVERLGWSVFAVVRTMAQVDQTIERMKEDGILAAIVDGNLDASSEGNIDGKSIVEKLRNVGIASIGNAGTGEVGADYERGGKSAIGGLSVLRAILEQIAST